MLVARLRSHLDAKVAMLLGMAAGIVVPYFGLQRWRTFPPRTPFESALDALIPFSPGWAPAYLSVCVLVPLFPMLALRREDVWRYGRGIAALCVPCFLCFLLFPMPGPRPEVGVQAGAYGWLVASTRRGTPSRRCTQASCCTRSSTGVGWHRPGRSLVGEAGQPAAGWR